MIKYYTRACNFYYETKLLIKKLALPLCGNNYIAFDTIEIFQRKNDRVKANIKFQNIKKLSKKKKKRS